MTEDGSSQIVPTGPRGLSMRASGLVRRGLDELAEARRGRGRVLLVEDDELILGTVGEFLEYLGYEVRSTSRADEAIRIAREFRPQVAMLGYVMPSIGGAQLGIELSGFLPETKILLSVERVGAADLDRLHRDGYDFATLPAPFTVEELLKKIAPWLPEGARRG